MGINFGTVIVYKIGPGVDQINRFGHGVSQYCFDEFQPPNGQTTGTAGNDNVLLPKLQ
jgi:hypothetical protein